VNSAVNFRNIVVNFCAEILNNLNEGENMSEECVTLNVILL